MRLDPIEACAIKLCMVSPFVDGKVKWYVSIQSFDHPRTYML